MKRCISLLIMSIFTYSISLFSMNDEYSDLEREVSAILNNFKRNVIIFLPSSVVQECMSKNTLKAHFLRFLYKKAETWVPAKEDRFFRKNLYEEFYQSDFHKDCNYNVHNHESSLCKACQGIQDLQGLSQDVKDILDFYNR